MYGRVLGNSRNKQNSQGKSKKGKNEIEVTRDIHKFFELVDSKHFLFSRSSNSEKDAHVDNTVGCLTPDNLPGIVKTITTALMTY